MAQKSLSKKQIEAIKLLITKYRMSGGDMTLQEIADAIGVRRQTLYNWMHKDEKFIAEYERRVKEHTRYSAGIAFAKMCDLLECGNRQVELAAAKDILDRAGLKPKDDINVTGIEPVVIIDDMGG